MIRRDTDYAFRLLQHIAASGGSSAAVAAREEAVPHPFAQKILKRLVSEGILKARGGRGGGFTMAKPASEVTLWDVIEAIQGPLLVNLCTGGGCVCKRMGSCRITSTWQSLQSNLSDFLHRHSLADVLPAASAGGAGTAPALSHSCAGGQACPRPHAHSPKPMENTAEG